MCHRAASDHTPGDLHIAGGVDIDQAAAAVAGDARRGQAGGAADEDRDATIISTRRAGRRDAHRLRRGERGIDEHLFTGRDADRRIGAEPAHAGLCDLATGDEPAEDLDVARADERDVAAGDGCIQR